MIPSVYKVTFHILHSAYTAGRIWSVTLQPTDQIPSPIDWGWKYSKGKKTVVDCCGEDDANLNDYIFFCTWKILCIRCKCVKKVILCLPFCSCICIATREHCLYYTGNFIYAYAEAYLEPNQTSTMKLFCKNSLWLKTVNCFCKKTPS